MKRFLVILLLISAIMLPACANILPVTSNDISEKSIGLYQLPKKVVIFEKPDLNSEIIYRAYWDEKIFNATSGTPNDLFTVFIPQKELAYSQVVDYEDDWIQVIYDSKNSKTGWIQAEDLRFMLWRNFYNMYGRKYGLYIFKDAPENVKDLHSATDDSSQIVHKLNKPSKIKLTVIKGNWALITAIEENLGKTGFLKWRNDDGKIYAFPSIK